MRLKEQLEEWVDRYNRPEFIEDDPISVPHRYSKKEDIEIAGFLVATFAWGNRKSILKNGMRLMEGMDDAPHDFVLNHQASDLQRFEDFVHRTFNAIDLQYFMTALQHLYREEGGLEVAMVGGFGADCSLRLCLSRFHKTFFTYPHLDRTRKHLSDPGKGSAAKRLNMFLRWMVRKDQCGVDFGIWDRIPMSELSIPLDVHTGNQARKLGLLTRKQNDWKAVVELDGELRKMDPVDPVKYDFALFGLGVNPLPGISF